MAEVCRTLRQRRYLILVSTIAGLVLALLYIVVKSSRYEGVARIEVGPTGTNSLGLSEMASKALNPSDPTIQLQSAVQILESDTIALEVMKQLGMASRSDFAGRWKLADHDLADADPKSRDALRALFRKALRVEIVPKTDIVVVSFVARDPHLAADVTNHVIRSYTERNFHSSYNSAMQVSDWLSKQMEGLRQKADESQAKLAKLQRSSGLIGVDETDNIVTDKLKQLDEQLTGAESDRMVKEARYRIADSGNPELIASTVPNPTLQVLRSQQAELRVQYAQLGTKFGMGYPKLVELANQNAQVDAAIDTELKNLAQRYKNEYLAASNAEALLRTRFKEQEQKAYDLNESAAQYAILKREVGSTQDLYETLQLKLQQAGIVAGLASANVGIVDLSQVPSEPIAPRPLQDLLLGLGAGLAVGIFSAVGLEALDNTLRSSEELETISGLATLATVPTVEKSIEPGSRQESTLFGDLRLMALDKPRSKVAEAFRALRTSLLLSSAGAPPKIVVVTSPGCGEGKSMTAINCAVVLAQHGANVLLVDADFRHPSVHSAFSPSQEPGLSCILGGACRPEDALVRCRQLPDLQFVPTGKTPSQPAELLASSKMHELLAVWRDQFDYVVIDAPPVCVVTDAVVLGTQADAIVLVVRWSCTTRHAILRARDLLLRAHTHIAGTVLNGVDSRYLDSYYFNPRGYFAKTSSAAYYDVHVQ